MIEEVKEFLSSYYYLSLKVDSLKEELRCLEELADGTQGCRFDEPRVQKTPSQKAPFLRYLDRIDRKQKEIDKKIEELISLKEEIEAAILTVDDPIMELVLTYRYINCWDWPEIASQMHYSLSYLYELHRKALSKVELKRT